MFDVLHLVLTFLVGFFVAYYLFGWRKKTDPPAVTVPESPVTPRIAISPPSPTAQPFKEEETPSPALVVPSTPSAAEPTLLTADQQKQPKSNGGSKRAKRSTSSTSSTSPSSTPSSPRAASHLTVVPSTATKKAHSEDSVTPAASPLLREAPPSATRGDPQLSTASQIAQQRQSRSLNAIPKSADTKDAIKKMSMGGSGAKTRSADRDSPTKLGKSSVGSAMAKKATTPVNLAEWRRTGVSASHSVLLGSGSSEGAGAGAAEAEEAGDDRPRRKFVSTTELPKYDDKKKGGSHTRAHVPARRLRSTSSNAKKDSTGRVYRFQLDELSPDLAELKKAFAHPVTGVRTKTITRKLTRKTYHHCFVGYDAVDWVLETVGGLDRRQAVNLGVRMWASGFFKHVGSKRPFSDGPNHFYFVVGKGRKARLSLKGSKHRRARRESVADLVMGEERPIQDALKPREGWLDVKQGDVWTKHWCLVTELRQIKEKIESHSGQVGEASGSDTNMTEDDQWSGWGLAIFEELVDKSLLDFVEELTAAGTGIKIKARRHYLRNYGRCFVGAKAVDWCIANRKSASRQEAILSMTTLLQKGLITHVDKEPVFKDSKHDYYKFNMPVGPGGGKEGEKEKKKEEKKEKKEKKKEEKERRKLERDDSLDYPGGPIYGADGGGGGGGMGGGGSGGKAGTCPIAIVSLSDCLIKLDKSGNHVEIVLYRNDGNRIFLHNWRAGASSASSASSASAGGGALSEDALSSSGRENRRSWPRKGGAFDESASYFSIRLHRKDDAYVREWIFALEAAMLLGDAGHEAFTLDATVVSDEEEDEDEDDEDEEEGGERRGGVAEGGEIEMIDEEAVTGDDEEEEEGAGDRRNSSEGGESMTEEEEEEEEEGDADKQQQQQELMDSTEKIVLEEMKREIALFEQRKRQQGTAASASAAKSANPVDDVDYTTVSDGELLKFLRARRLVVADAMVLMKSSVGYRRRNNLYNIKIADVMQEVGGCMLQLVEGARDKEGRVVLLVQPQNYTPAASPPLNVVRAVMYLLDKAQEDVEVQRKGFTVLVDGTGSKYSNFDPKMPRVLLDGIISRYPARIGYTIITNMPWFFRFVWAVIRPLLSEKLAQRFHIVTVDRLSEFVPKERLLPIYGGTLEYDHRAWIREQHAKEGLPYQG